MTKVRPLFTLGLSHRGFDNPNYWSCSVQIILINQIRVFYASEGISEVLTFWSEYTTCPRWHENVTTKQLSSSSKYSTSFEILLVQSICETIVQNVVKAWNVADMLQSSYKWLLASDPILKFKMADVAAISKWPPYTFWKKNLEITVEKYYKFYCNLILHSIL